MQYQDLGQLRPLVLTSGQWWRLLGVLRPSGGFVFVSEAWGHMTNQNNHTDENVRQGRVMITSETSAFIPGRADI